MNKTSIEWADYVWNPVTGCTKVSDGCRNCYAEAIAKRFWGERKFGDVMCHPERLDQPLKVKKGGRVFVNSMSDLFHPDVPLDFIRRVYKTMWAADWHTYIILTKRPAAARLAMNLDFFTQGSKVYGHNIWLGVSVDDQRTADERIPLLLQTPAAVRFVSVEPMLGPVNMELIPDALYESGMPFPWQRMSNDGPGGIDWVICGGESGPRRRPMRMDWVQSLRDQCVGASVPFFLKQMQVNGKMTSLPELDGQVWDQTP